MAFVVFLSLCTDKLSYVCISRDDHPEVVFSSMQHIMTILLEESEDVQEHLLLSLLSKLGRNRSVSISNVARSRHGYCYDLRLVVVWNIRQLIFEICDCRTLVLLPENSLCKS